VTFLEILWWYLTAGIFLYPVYIWIDESISDRDEVSGGWFRVFIYPIIWPWTYLAIIYDLLTDFQQGRDDNE
jgi:hypothetical protein